MTIARCRDRVALLQAQKRDIDAAIAELNQFVDYLEQHPTQE